MPTANHIKVTLFAISDSKSVILRISEDNNVNSKSPVNSLDLKIFSSPEGVPAINVTVVRNSTSFSNYSNLNSLNKELLLQQALLSSEAYKSFSRVFSIRNEEFLIPFAYEKINGKKYIILNEREVPVILFKNFEELASCTDDSEAGIFVNVINLIQTLELNKRFSHMFVNRNMNLIEAILLGESAIEKKYNNKPWFGNINIQTPDQFYFYKPLYPFSFHEATLTNKLSEFISTLSYLHSHPEFKLLNLGGTIIENNNKTFDGTILQYNTGENISCIIDNFNPIHWNTHILRTYNKKNEALGLQYPHGKVLVNASFADPQYYRNIPKHDLITASDNKRFITAYFNNDKYTGMGINIEKLNAEYLMSKEYFLNSKPVVVSYEHFKNFCDHTD